MQALQQILGYQFRRPALLRQALTHPSVHYEAGQQQPDNQRLEFLGDAVVQLVISEMLYVLLPDMDEGRLTKARAALVSYKSMAAIARRFEFGKFLFMGRSELASGGHLRDAALADMVEAILGAIYLDGGLEASSKAVALLFGESLKQSRAHAIEEPNPKGRLQEIIQDFTSILPCYRIVGQTGPEHGRRFVATVSWAEHLLGEGTGTSKKDAEIEAAAVAVSNPLLMKIVDSLKAQKPAL